MESSGGQPIPRWAASLATAAWQSMNTAIRLLAQVDAVFGVRCPWDVCAMTKAEAYVCPLGDFTQAGVVTIADHLRSYWHLMRTATPALTAFTVLRAAVETTASMGWVWSESDSDERHRRALLSTKRDVVTFTAGGSTDPKHRYPTQRLGIDPIKAADLLGLSMTGSAPKPTKLMVDVNAQGLHAVLSGAAHGSREVVGVIVDNTADGGQRIVPHRRLSELTWRDAEKIIRPTLAQIRKDLSGFELHRGATPPSLPEVGAGSEGRW
jgi:hypothetical protein